MMTTGLVKDEDLRIDIVFVLLLVVLDCPANCWVLGQPELARSDFAALYYCCS